MNAGLYKSKAVLLKNECRAVLLMFMSFDTVSLMRADISASMCVVTFDPHADQVMEVIF